MQHVELALVIGGLNPTISRLTKSIECFDGQHQLPAWTLHALRGWLWFLSLLAIDFDHADLARISRSCPVGLRSQKSHLFSSIAERKMPQTREDL